MSASELRELDEWIAQHVMGLGRDIRITGTTNTIRGFTNNPYWTEDHHTTRRILAYCSAPAYTSEPDNAMMVLEKCAEKYTTLICGPRDGGRGGWLVKTWDEVVEGDASKTLPLAICVFAKKLFTK